MDYLNPLSHSVWTDLIFLVVVLQVVLAPGFLLEQWVTFKMRHCPGASNYVPGSDNKPFPKASWE